MSNLEDEQDTQQNESTAESREGWCSGRLVWRPQHDKKYRAAAGWYQRPLSQVCMNSVASAKGQNERAILQRKDVMNLRGT